MILSLCMKRPPFTITQNILALCTHIAQLLGEHAGINRPIPQPQLRRRNRIKSILSSLAIEGNSLSEDQVSDLINNKRVIGPQKDIIEVQNAILVYDALRTFKPTNEKHLLKAHKMLMNNLVSDAGQFRSGNVGVFKKRLLVHMAPKAELVPALIDNLLTFIGDDKETHPFIKSCVFHYEFEFIHPFSDGNGRMGRLWQSVILKEFNDIFEYIPIESVVRKKQKLYYDVLAQADKIGESTPFIQFMLQAVYDATKAFMKELKPKKLTIEERISSAKVYFKNSDFSRKEYIEFHKILSSATASRDLLFGVEHKIIKKAGQKALTTYSFI
jgi:Fic family protein